MGLGRVRGASKEEEGRPKELGRVTGLPAIVKTLALILGEMSELRWD